MAATQTMSRITRDGVARLVGRRLRAISDTGVEILDFMGKRYVAVIIGMKNGPTTFPLWRYSLTKDGRLLIHDEKALLWVLWSIRGRVWIEWTSMSFAGDILTVDTPQGTGRYQIEEQPPPRPLPPGLVLPARKR